MTIDCNYPYDTEITTGGTIIVSPNYPYAYKPDKDCRTTIKFGFSNRIRIKFLNFEVEQHPRCDYDYLAIYDGRNENSRQIGPKLCGEIRPAPVQSTGNTMHILFRTDSSGQHTGFQIQVMKIGNAI